jgi:hypothetical protein
VIDQARLAESLAQLDAGTRALLDLSLRRAIPDDQVAKVLGVEAASIPPRRARGIAQLADMMEVPGPSELAALLIAIPDLPEEAWGVPAPAPFVGSVSRARRAKAFRRVAVAASPLVALGAVMAAVLVSSSDHSGGGPAPGGATRGGGGAGAPATASAPQARHGLPPGVTLTQAPDRRSGHRGAHHSARLHHRARHAGGVAEPAVFTHQPAHNAPVAFQPAPVVRQEPRHVSHHQAPAKPKVPVPVPTPAPAPVQTPSQPVSSPAPSVPASPPVQVSAPVTQTVQSAPTPNKPYKPPPPQPDLSGSSHDGGDDGDGQTGCQHRGGDDGDSSGQSNGHGWHHGNSQPAAQQGGRGGQPWSPPGLFRKHHGH